MLGTKRLYVIGLAFAIVGWFASHFVSINGLEQIRLTPKLSWIPTAGDVQSHASRNAERLVAWDDTKESSWASSQSSRNYVSHRIAPTGAVATDSVANFLASPNDGGMTSGEVGSSNLGSLGGVIAPTIRIASFNLDEFGEDKLRKLPVAETLARIIRRFDVIALQGIAPRQPELLPLVTELVNQKGRKFDFIVGPSVGREQKQQFVFLFDTDRIETDRGQLYTVEDPQDLVTYEPLVAWFRTKLPKRRESFTFSLVNIRIPPARVEEELALLPSLIRSIRNDGRLEDDIILAGEFMASSHRLAAISGLEVTLAIEGVPTTVAGDAMTGNILFPKRTTDEFTGRSGVVDFLRQLNLSYDQATQVSSSLPIWAEFTAYEGAIDR